jgi:hypothetical protein
MEKVKAALMLVDVKLSLGSQANMAPNLPEIL